MRFNRKELDEIDNTYCEPSTEIQLIGGNVKRDKVIYLDNRILLSLV